MMLLRKFINIPNAVAAPDWLALSILTFLIVGLVGCGSTPVKKKVAANVQSSVVEVPVEAAEKFKLAVNNMNDGNDDQAEKQLIELTQTYPQLSGPFANLGVLYSKRENWADAEKYLVLAAEKNHRNAKVYNQLGFNFRKQGKFDKARKAYRDALKANPNHSDTYLNLGILYDIYLGKLETAAKFYKKYQSMQHQPDSKVAGWLVDIERRIGKQQQQTAEAMQ